MNKQLARVLLSLTVMALAATFVVHGSSLGRVQKHRWQRNTTEIVWHGRYSNCDYGYYVDLPEGVVAHTPKPPQPNHGAVIDLSRPGSGKELPIQLHRYLSIYSSYNVTDLSSLTPIVDEQLSIIGQGRRSFRVIAKSPARLAGIPATMVKARYVDADGTAIILGIIAYRPSDARGLGNIVYKVMLTSTRATFGQDRAAFKAVLAGFHMTPLPLGACSND